MARRTIPPGYGNDPDFRKPKTWRTWPLTRSANQREIVGVLSDIILPGTAQHAAPSKIRIVDFFDEWVSAPYEDQQKDRTLITAGLTMVDAEAQRRFRTDFVKLKPKQRLAVVDAIASPTNHDRAIFERFRFLLVGGYFTSNVGFDAIGYRGNKILGSFPEVPPEIRKSIDATVS